MDPHITHNPHNSILSDKYLWIIDVIWYHNLRKCNCTLSNKRRLFAKNKKQKKSMGSSFSFHFEEYYKGSKQWK